MNQKDAEKAMSDFNEEIKDIYHLKVPFEIFILRYSLSGRRRA